MSDDATLKTFGTTDDGRFKRTAIRTGGTDAISFDIVMANGRRLCRINVFEHDNGATVDVIAASGMASTVRSWRDGDLVLEQSITSLTSIELKGRGTP
jgi:hypothetical protein